MNPTLEDAIAEVRRELALRDRVYPSFVARGTMKKATGDLQIKRLERALRALTDFSRAVRLAEEAQSASACVGMAKTFGNDVPPAEVSRLLSALTELASTLGVHPHTFTTQQ